MKMAKKERKILMDLVRRISKALLEEILTLLVLMALCVIETAALVEGQIYTRDVPETLQRLKCPGVLIILAIEGAEMFIDKEKNIISLGCASLLFLLMKFSVATVLVVVMSVLIISLIAFIFEEKAWGNIDEREESFEKNK